MDAWSSIKDMRYSRAYHGACAAKNNNYIYVFGGLQDHNIINSIEQYDIMQELWTEL